MLALKILGAIDMISALAFLMLIFGITPFIPLVIFCVLLMLLKGIFFIKDILSVLDIFFALLLFLSIIFNIPTALYWIPAFILLAKGIVSFA